MKKRRLLQRTEELVKAKHFPHEIMNKGRLPLATWIYRVGLQDYGYVLNAAMVFHKYSVRCGGKYRFS